MKLSANSKLFLGISISLILVFLVGLFSYLSLKSVESDYLSVRHTEKIISKTNDIVADIWEAEAVQRGYLLRGNKEFTTQFFNINNDLREEMEQLSGYVIDNKQQSQNISKFEVLVQKKMQVLSNLIRVRDSNYEGKESELELFYSSKALMDEIYNLSIKIKSIENSLLDTRQLNSQIAITKTILVIFTGTALIFIIVIVLFSQIRKAFIEQKHAQLELTNVNASLEEAIENNKNKNWILTGISNLNKKLQGELSIEDISENIIQSICQYAGGKIGGIYLSEDDEDTLKLKAGYALTITQNTKLVFSVKESWLGQVVKNKKAEIVDGELIQNLNIETGLLKNIPLQSLIIPFYYNNKLIGLLEVGFIDEISSTVKEFVDNATEIIGIAINTARARERMKILFNQIQQQAEELESQQEELRVSNEELFNKTSLLQASEEELRVQQEELRQANFELEEKARLLESNNEVIVNAKDSLAIKMKELEQTSKYKSEFLANMSHELRTPLNSILILARILKDNKLQHLGAEEVKFANVIFNAGSDLLALINSILDLSKIESGFIELNPENVKYSEVKEELFELFEEVAVGKKVDFNIEIDSNLPETIYIDKQRLEQIIKNLLSNAFKFTPEGGRVNVKFYKENNRVNIAVKDTGIGIPLEKQKIIFEAFQQADGSTSREYGGTGLGLSISRELSKLMNGEISLESKPNEGSLFTLSFLLDNNTKITVNEVFNDSFDIKQPLLSNNLVENKIIKNNREKPLILIAEDDEIFNDLLNDYSIKNGFDTIQIFNGDEVEKQVEKHLPDAILLDVILPGIDGWQILKSIKSNPHITHIPVHMMSSGDFSRNKAINAGANSFLQKPLNDHQLDNIFKNYFKENNIEIKKILLIEDQVIDSDILKGLFEQKNLIVVQAFTGEESMLKLAEQSFDCIILDLNLPDISGIELLEKIKSENNLIDIPVIINTAMDLDKDKLNRILKHSHATVLKSVKSTDRLIDEVHLFLHKIKQIDSSTVKTYVTQSRDLNNKTVLLVDDDMRNVFALSSILDQHGLKIEIANDGIEALSKLEELGAVDIILMDIMMPRMDGYETMERIRSNHKWHKLPIIALTAKAMKEDKDKCLNAGANDYITKPVDVDQLVSLIKVWIS
jgi:CheY-like chemotaxis protein/CHASE3 domain sensor protein